MWVQPALGLLRDEDGLPQSFVSQFVNVTEAHEAREALRFMATHDPLTQLLNRRELLVRMSMMLAARAARPQPHGGAVRRPRRAQAGQRHLRPLPPATSSSSRRPAHPGPGARRGPRRRASAATSSSSCFRRCIGIDDALAVADKIIAAIAEPLFIAGEEVPLGVSIGVAVAEVGEDATTLLRNADAALYRAKTAGRNRIEVHRPDLRPAVAGR